MIKTVIFDIGGVLTDFRWRQFFVDTGYDQEIIDRIIKATVMQPDWAEYDRGVMSEEEVLDAFCKNDPEIATQIKECLSNIENLVTREAYAIPWVKSLKNRGYQVLYLSNFSRKAHEDCIGALDFIPYTDGGILSYMDHVIKPEKEIYELLMSRYNLVPEECVFIDDTEKNLVTAKELGMETIHFTSKEQAMSDLEKLLWRDMENLE